MTESCLIIESCFENLTGTDSLSSFACRFELPAQKVVCRGRVAVTLVYLSFHYYL